MRPLLLVIALASCCVPLGASAQPTTSEEINRLELELRQIENRAVRIGRGSTIQESVANVRARRAELEEQMRRLDEAMPRMRASLDEIEAVRRQMAEAWVVTPQDGAEEAVEEMVMHYVELALSQVGRRVAGAVTLFLDVVEIGGKKYIKSVNVAALEEMVRRGEVDLELVYGIYRVMDIEARQARRKEAQLQALQSEWDQAMERLARARGERRHASTVRDRDAAGDRELEAEGTLRVWSIGWYETASEHRGENGRFVYRCPPYEGGAAGVWGTDLYTYDSSICMAAVHSGFISQARGGRVTIEMRTAPEKFRGSVRNGVSSYDWETVSNHRAFAVVGN